MDEIVKHQIMKAAFHSLGKATQDNFIPVWVELDPITSMLKVAEERTLTREEKEKQIVEFSKFASRLIKG